MIRNDLHPTSLLQTAVVDGVKIASGPRGSGRTTWLLEQVTEWLWGHDGDAYVICASRIHADFINKWMAREGFVGATAVTVSESIQNLRGQYRPAAFVDDADLPNVARVVDEIHALYRVVAMTIESA